jgi:hypothetical protein
MENPPETSYPKMPVVGFIMPAELGNFPPAFTHSSLINSGAQLNAALDNPFDHNRLSARLIAAVRPLD